MIKLTEILAEIGEGSSKPFEYKKGFMSAGFKRKGGFVYDIAGEIRNDTGEFVLQEMPIELQAIPFREMLEYVGDELLDLEGHEVSDEYFNFLGKPEPLKDIWGLEILFTQKRASRSARFDLVNDRVFMFRLMATLKEIMLAEIKKSKIQLLRYQPSKEDDELDLDASKTGRHRLYSIFIKKAFPGAKEFFHKEGDYILYKLT
jgi:hypothetical protein